MTIALNLPTYIAAAIVFGFIAIHFGEKSKASVSRSALFVMIAVVALLVFVGQYGPAQTYVSAITAVFHR